MSASSAPRIAVEEEYLLLDPVDARPVDAAADVLSIAVARLASNTDPSHGCTLRPDMIGAQVEIATPVCRTLGEVRVHLTAARRVLATAAEQVGVVLAPVGAAPVEGSAPAQLTPGERYHAIERTAPALVREQLLSGMNVHVAVPDRAAGITVMNRLRPWLHVLLALSANSPLWRGQDSGFASWRSVQTQRWAVQGPPPRFAGVKDYDHRVDRLVEAGVVVDRAQIYWSMRLAERYPTVEVRVADVQLDVESAVMLTGLVRALVVLALVHAEQGRPEPVVSGELLRAATWQAARSGVTAGLVDLFPPGRRSAAGADAGLQPAVDVVGHLLHVVEPVAETAGLNDVSAAMAASLLGGSGAERQRRAVTGGGMGALLDLLRTHTAQRTFRDAAMWSPAGSARAPVPVRTHIDGALVLQMPASLEPGPASDRHGDGVEVRSPRGTVRRAGVVTVDPVLPEPGHHLVARPAVGDRSTLG